MPRILVLFGNVPLLGNERANIETLDQLQQRKAKVLFLIRREHTVDSTQKELKRRGLAFLFVSYFDAIGIGVGIYVWIRNVIGILGGSWALLRQIRLFKATHLHTGSTAWVLNFMPALMLSRLPLVFRAGEMPPRHHFLWRWVWKYTCRRVSTFVCDSYFIKNEIVAIGASADRCEVIYAPAPSRSRSSMPAQKRTLSEITILYIGQISAYKGVDLLVDVAQRLVAEFPVRFIIAGDHSWKNPLGQSLVENIRKLNLQDRIVFTGYLDEIDGLYSSARLHVAPSVGVEAYGLTVLEAKDHGLPSVVFPSGGLQELVENGVDGRICADKSAKGLEDGLRYYLEAPTLLEKHGKAARASLTTRLRVHEFGDRWARTYGMRI